MHNRNTRMRRKKGRNRRNIETIITENLYQATDPGSLENTKRINAKKGQLYHIQTTEKQRLKKKS